MRRVMIVEETEGFETLNKKDATDFARISAAKGLGDIFRQLQKPERDLNSR